MHLRHHLYHVPKQQRGRMELGRWRGLPGGGSRALAWAEEAEGTGRRHHAQHLCMVLGFSLVGGA